MAEAKQVILITGASRGVGAETARRLAGPETHLFLNYNSKAARAESVAQEVREHGGHATVVQADIVEAVQVRAMFAQVQAEAGKLDVLILNASGGLEKHKPADYSLRLNRDAQIQLLEAALPLMPAGGRVVFVTSHQAHFYHEKPVAAVYEVVATGKRAGEDELRDRIPEMSRCGIRLTVVSGGMIEGTITPRLMERAERGLMAKRREEIGELITVPEFANAIAAAARSDEATGTTIYVGKTEG